jgi:hypothetical protein
MDDQAPAANNGAEPEGGIPPVDIPQPQAPPAAQPATKEQLADVEKQMTGFEKATLRWAKLAVLLSGAAALFVCLQWYEMHEGGVDTHNLAEAAGDAANAASDQADAAQQFSDTAEDINDGISAAAAQLQAATKNAKASINATQEALRLEQRPWVFISGMDLKPLVLNEPFTVMYSIKNEGRTPGISHKEGRIFMRISPSPINRLPEDTSIPPQFQLGTIFPGIVYGPETMDSTANCSIGTCVVENAHIAAYNAKPPTIWVYFYGRIVYTDTWGGKHTTSFCSVSNGTPTFSACMEGVYPTYAN